MPPLICPSPTILDQSFPRNNDELLNVATAFGEIQQSVENGAIVILLTETLKIFIGDFDWAQTAPYPILATIYQLLNQWSLQPSENVVTICTDDINNFESHLIPEGTINSGLVTIWSEEVGKLLVKHDRNAKNEEYYIGIASEDAFCGLPKKKYQNPNNKRLFPLIGPNDINSLSDAYSWEVPINIRTMNIPFNTTLDFWSIIGVTDIKKPKGDSHYHFFFRGLKWQLSANNDPIPEDYLSELEGIVNFPKCVIKYLLVNRKLPEKKLRLS
jgi:hypothetical protein